MLLCLPVRSYIGGAMDTPGKLPDHLAAWVKRMEDRNRERDAMRVRESDTQPGDLTRASIAAVKITREIPLWGILSVVAMLGGQAVSTYYGQAQLTEKVILLTTEVRTMNQELNRATNAQTGFEYKLEDLRRRLEAVEDALRPPRK